jgi:3'-phosphoadenosine 5'-phosphosulfate sulfotransferase (PAPS reductase)/FAD synthetase
MTDPFKITEPTCISFSGGRTSAYMLWRVLQANGGKLPDETVVCFANTGKEDEATLRFVQRVSDEWAVPIVWLEFRDTEERFEVVSFETASRKGQPFEALIRKRNYLPNPVTRFCTIDLKIRPIGRYLLSIGMAETKTEAENMSMIGMRADEQRRAAKIAESEKKIVVRTAASMATRNQIHATRAAGGTQKPPDDGRPPRWRNLGGHATPRAFLSPGVRRLFTLFLL